MSKSEYAGVKLRAILLARGLREVDLVDDSVHSKFVNQLVHGKAPADGVKLQRIAQRLKIPSRLLTDDTIWPGDGHRAGLNESEIRTMDWLRMLHEWYLRHAGPETTQKFMGLDFDALHRQSEILQGLARSFGDEAVIRVFVGADYEDGRFDREFAHIERLSTRSRAVRKKILAYVADLPPEERLPGRSFPALRLGDLELEVSFSQALPGVREDVRYAAKRQGRSRHLTVRSRMDDFRLAFVLAREVAIHLAARDELIAPETYAEHHWPCAIDTYQRSKGEALINRFAAAILLPKPVIAARERDLLVHFSDEAVERACVDLACAPETLLLRIVQIHPRQTHFIRIDTPGAEGPFSLEKLFRGNGLPVLHRYASRGLFPESWGVLKSVAKFFASDPARASAASRHVQVTRIPQYGNESYICMTLTYPRFGGGAKALCLGFRLRDFKKLYRALPTLSEKKTAVDSASYDVDWSTLVTLEKQSRQRR